ncbi:MAG: SEC14 family lipid-binding protein [Flavobacterium sp.]
MYECPVCKADPTSHSLAKLTETDDIVYYYTCPAKASKYNDRDGILSHYDGELTQKGSKPWVWIFDCTGFDMRHAIEIRLAIDMAKLITQSHGDSLTKVCVINPTIFIHIVVNAIWPFLSKHIRSIIVYDSNNQFVLEG